MLNRQVRQQQADASSSAAAVDDSFLQVCAGAGGGEGAGLGEGHGAGRGEVAGRGRSGVTGAGHPANPADPPAPHRCLSRLMLHRGAAPTHPDDTCGAPQPCADGPASPASSLLPPPQRMGSLSEEELRSELSSRIKALQRRVAGLPSSTTQEKASGGELAAAQAGAPCVLCCVCVGGCLGLVSALSRLGVCWGREGGGYSPPSKPSGWPQLLTSCCRLQSKALRRPPPATAATAAPLTLPGSPPTLTLPLPSTCRTCSPSRSSGCGRTCRRRRRWCGTRSGWWGPCWVRCAPPRRRPRRGIRPTPSGWRSTTRHSWRRRRRRFSAPRRRR